MLTSLVRQRSPQCVRAISTTLSVNSADQVVDRERREALEKLYRVEHVTPDKKGYNLLTTASLNKGMAFSMKERQYLGIHGLLPPAFMSQEQQAYRVMKRIRDEHDDFQKYLILDSLQSRTEKLFYRVLCENPKELMPIVYTPTVGMACQRFGEMYRHPKGLYITINDNSISAIYKILSNWPEKNIQAIVVTDGERILGLGDLGAYGIGIPVGKMALYCALGGVQPQQCLPVVLDVGTNNQKLLDDPFYIGLRRNRVRGPLYEELVDNFMKAVTKRFGRDTLIQFEDFAFANAFALLDKYKDEYCTFNDDIQGTAAVAVAGLLATTRVTKKKLSEQKILFLGAGSATLGISELIVAQMVEEGLTREEAQARIFLINSKGLVTKEKAVNLTARAKQYAKELPHTANLLEIVKMIKPNALLGLSTVRGAFTPEVIQEMAKNNPRPIIFALSNPTAKAECTAEDAYKYTNGQVLFASGSPFDNVEMFGKLFKPGQGNNAYIFPGVALGAILFKAKRIPNHVFLIAARRCAASVTEKSLNVYSRLYPRLKNARDLSADIALDVGNYLYEQNLASLHPKPEDMEMYIQSQIYSYEYDPVVAELGEAFEWPDRDTRQGYPVPKMTRTSMDDE
ncbi:unnamed protein product [Cylicocyclus nassatus]|uniref:Malic enzyme n=1 Tax=Cylicocyclus nassatus TaxID=53992 RepID=A0AA36MAP9_CYLNA|nr:unnamed protein product [Cylicocyclus nassatus]